jgi:glycosyltransferase involved in cell wall biosynthesis
MRWPIQEPRVPDERPIALLTNVVPDYRREPFRMLDEAENVDVLAWGEPGRSQRAAVRAIASGRYRAVIAGLGGRLALPGSYLATRRAGIPFVLWASMWDHPRTPAHRLSRLPTRAIYRNADAIVTYGPHVTKYVQSHRADGNVFEAPQAVDQSHFGKPVTKEERDVARARANAPDDAFLALFVGRLEREKGIEVLTDAWRKADLNDTATLAFAGTGPLKPPNAIGQVDKQDLPALYAAADAVVLPSIRTATFTEPWGLVCNEAMHQGTPVIASDAVGAAAGGLVVDGRNGLVVPQGDSDALASRIRTLAHNPGLREQLGAAAKADVANYTFDAWVNGMRAAINAVGASRQDPTC